MMFVESGFLSDSPKPAPVPAGNPRRVLIFGAATMLVLGGFGIAAFLSIGQAHPKAAEMRFDNGSFDMIAFISHAHPRLAILQAILCSRYEPENASCRAVSD